MKKLPPLKTIGEIDFQQIINDHRPPEHGKYRLPRISFIGYFRHLSMTSQRDICKHLGFEYYHQIPMATHNTELMQLMQTKWSDITKTHTKLVVIGNAYENTPYGDFEIPLYKKYKKDSMPAIYQYNIPAILEEELWKLHVSYPNINNSLQWESKYLHPLK